MSSPELDAEIEKWKTCLGKQAVMSAADIDELEDHLRHQIENLLLAGLSEDEAFLIAVKRLGNLQAVSREYAAVYSGRLWQKLMASPAADTASQPWLNREFLLVIGLALGAALAIQLPRLWGLEIGSSAHIRNVSFYCLPFLAGYFCWKRQLGRSSLTTLAPAFGAALLFANVYPFTPQGNTEILTILHLPIALWFLVGLVYTGDWWQSAGRRMDFVRFSGEFAIYYVLIALGGGLLSAVTLGLFGFIGLDLEEFIPFVVLPCGAMGAVLVVAWLVEAKQAAIENMAPVLTRVFTPLFTVALAAFLLALLVTGNVIDVQREILIALDLLLVIILGLVLYAVSARDPGAGPDWFDSLQLILIIAALLVDLLALAAITGRISEMGFTPNRVAALGENLLLLLSLTGSAWYYWRFIQGHCGFAALENWQTRIIPLLALWAASVVVLFPPLFGYI